MSEFEIAVNNLLKEQPNNQLALAFKNGFKHNCNCHNGRDMFMPKCFNNYNPSYKYQGDEPVEFNEKEGYTAIKWHDGTQTLAKLDSEDGGFDYEMGMLICVAKKFVRGLNIHELFVQNKKAEDGSNVEIYADKETVKTCLKQLIRNSSFRAYRDIHSFINDYLYERELNEIQKKAFVKKLEKKKKYIEKIKKLKAEGKFVSRAEKEAMHERYLRLSAMEQYEKEKKEVERLEREYGNGSRKGFFG